MIVHVASPLRSYTGGEAVVTAEGFDLAELLHDLDRRFPGIRFRMIDEHDRLRRHVLLFLDKERTEDLARSLDGVGEVHLVAALSGG